MQNIIRRVQENDNYVWDLNTLAWVPAQQALLKTDTLTVAADVSDRAGRLLGHVTVDSMPSTAVTGPLTDTQLRASAVPVSLASAPSTPVTNAGLTNLDVALSTRLKPADTLAGVTTVGAVTSITNPVAVTGPLTDTQLRATRVPVDPSGVTSPVSAASLPLPSNAAVESGGALERVSARQDVNTRIAHLSLLAALAAPANGFVPVEVPSFLVG
jgi:hypothetical protein